jgi:hypothetical protein
VEEPSGRTLPRRIGLLAVVPVLAVAIADGIIATKYDDHPRPTTTAAHQLARPSAASGVLDRTPASGASATSARTRAINAMLAARADAVLHDDRAAFLASVDPAQPKFRAEQAREFAAIQALPLATWTYSIDPSTSHSDAAATARYGAPTWAPSVFSLDYRLRGFDDQPASLQQYPTFVERHGHWYVASFDDFRADGDVSAVDIWNFGPVRIVRAPNVLVLGHPGSLALMRQVADQAASAIPRVTAVWRRTWARRVVVLVPSTEHEMAAVIGGASDLSQIAAVASAEVQQCPGPPNPTDNRVAINPSNWPKLSVLGRSIVLTHEITHVASRADTGSCMPTWIVEGLADYVGYLHSGLSVQLIAGELGSAVRAGRLPRTLPTEADFAASNARLELAYEQAWMACRLIAATYGQSALVRFYVTVGTATDPAVGLRHAFAVLHLTEKRFVADWRTSLRSQLA